MRFFISILLVIVTIFMPISFFNVSATELLDTSDDIAIYPVPFAEQVQLTEEDNNSVIDAATGIKYLSVNDFYNCVGNAAIRNNPSLEYFIQTSLDGGENYIYSNCDSYEVIQSVQNKVVHVEPENLIAQEIPETPSLMSYGSITSNAQGTLPYSRICRLFVKYKNDKNVYVANSFGTGFFVGPSHIATSAHNLETTYNGEKIKAYSISVYYSFTDPNSQKVKFAVTTTSNYSKYVNYDPLNDGEVNMVGYDYGIVNLYADIGNICSYIKLCPEDINTGEQYHIQGFPGRYYGAVEKDSSSNIPNEMRSSIGSISNINNSLFTFNFDFYQGMSGAPLMYIKDGNLQAVGIGKGRNEEKQINYATRINWDVFTFFNKHVGFKNCSMYQINDSTKSNNIKLFQQYINKNLPAKYLGTLLEIDGRFGPASKKAAIKLLQYWLNNAYGAGLEIDGGFGPATTNAVRSIVYGNQGMGVYILQGLLYGNGYDPKGFDGSFGVNGGQGCLYAVKYFQSDNNLAVDGRAGPATLKALCS